MRAWVIRSLIVFRFSVHKKCCRANQCIFIGSVVRVGGMWNWVLDGGKGLKTLSRGNTRNNNLVGCSWRRARTKSNLAFIGCKLEFNSASVPRCVSDDARYMRLLFPWCRRRLLTLSLNSYLYENNITALNLHSESEYIPMKYLWNTLPR